MRRTPAILHAPRWRFHSHRRLPQGGSVTVHVHLDDPRLERRRIRVRGDARLVDVYALDGEPCFSPPEAASRLALAPPLPAPPRPVQQDLFA